MLIAIYKTTCLYTHEYRSSVCMLSGKYIATGGAICVLLDICYEEWLAVTCKDLATGNVDDIMDLKCSVGQATSGQAKCVLTFTKLAAAKAMFAVARTWWYWHDKGSPAQKQHWFTVRWWVQSQSSSSWS